MSKAPVNETTFDHMVKILSVSPSDVDHAGLCSILQQRRAELETNCRWTVYPANSIVSATKILAEEEFPIVISECDLLPGTWQRVLEFISLAPDPPLLIVASRLADERLWAEVVNLGAWDLLRKPFDTQEVIWVLASAWRHWQDRHKVVTKEPAPATRT